MQKVRFCILSPLNGFLIELASICSVSTCAALNSASDDGNSHSTNCKMATILEEWTKEDVHSVVRFLWPKKVEIYCELVTVYGGNLMAV